MENLKNAAYDFYFLLSRKYPRNASLELVGNRYNLEKGEREILNRAIYGQDVALKRRGKQFKTALWSDKVITIDGHNVHITLESIISGRTVVLANDGPIRDTAGLSGAFKHTELTLYVVEVVKKFFEKYTPAGLVILFDAPVSKSGELARLYRTALTGLSVPLKCAAVPVPEKLFDYNSTLIASSDSAVMDLSRNWLDIPRFIVDDMNFRMEFFDFSYLDFSPILY